MTSGHDRDMWGEAVERDREEPVRGFLLSPPDKAPGSVFAYSQPCTYTLAAIIQRRTGQRLSEYLRPRLLDPLGIGDVGWQCWPAGRELGFSGLFARTEDVAKLGQLYLQRGRWGKRRTGPRDVRRGGHVPADQHPGNGEPRLATGVRLPVLDGPPRLSR